MRSKFPLVAILCATLFVACNLPVPQRTPTLVEGASFTAAAETISAQLTAISVPTHTAPASPQKPTTAPIITLPATPSATPTTKSTEIPAPTPTIDIHATAAIPTELSDDPRQHLGEPAWHDTFKSSQGWPLFYDEHVSYAIKNNKMVMTAKLAENWDSWIISKTTLGDFYMELAAVAGECDGLDRYGMIVRTPNFNSGYLYGISCDGRYSLRKWDGKTFTNLLDWTTSPSLRKGSSPNRIGLMAKGSELTLYANGMQLNKVEDEEFLFGAFGLFIAAKTTPGFEVKVSEMSYWDAP